MISGGDTGNHRNPIPDHVWNTISEPEINFKSRKGHLTKHQDKALKNKILKLHTDDIDLAVFTPFNVQLYIKSSQVIPKRNIYTWAIIVFKQIFTYLSKRKTITRSGIIFRIKVDE